MSFLTQGYCIGGSNFLCISAMGIGAALVYGAFWASGNVGPITTVANYVKGGLQGWSLFNMFGKAYTAGAANPTAALVASVGSALATWGVTALGIVTQEQLTSFSTDIVVNGLALWGINYASAWFWGAKALSL